MKNWAFAAIIFLLGASMLTPRAHADPTVAPKNPRNGPYQGTGDRDISQSAWQSWQAPVGTVDPERLIPDNSGDSTASGTLPQNHADPFKSDSFQLANNLKDGKPIQIEQSKPIEKIESDTADSTSTPTAVVATAAPKPKSNSRRILIIALISVAFLGYRKFRRANAGPYPPKPNFL